MYRRYRAEYKREEINMSEKITLKSYPSSYLEALAMSYVNSRDLSSLNPEQILDLYEDALKHMKIHQGKKVASDWVADSIEIN